LREAGKPVKKNENEAEVEREWDMINPSESKVEGEELWKEQGDWVHVQKHSLWLARKLGFHGVLVGIGSIFSAIRPPLFCHGNHSFVYRTSNF
jgi:hypothetical protein